MSLADVVTEIRAGSRIERRALLAGGIVIVVVVFALNVGMFTFRARMNSLAEKVDILTGVADDQASTLKSLAETVENLSKNSNAEARFREDVRSYLTAPTREARQAALEELRTGTTTTGTTQPVRQGPPGPPGPAGPAGPPGATPPTTTTTRPPIFCFTGVCFG